MAAFGVNYWPAYAGPAMWRDFRPQEIARDLAALRAQGISYVRFCLFWPDFMPTPERVEGVMLDRLAAFLDLLAAHGLKGQLSFLVGHMSGQNWPPAWLGDPAKLYGDPGLLDVQDLYFSQVVERVRSHPALEAYIVSNEMPHFTGPVSEALVRPWFARLRAVIRRLDPQRPIGTGDGGWSNLGPSNGFPADLPQDFLGPHGYEFDTREERLIAAYGLAVSAASARANGRPVWFEEFGAPHAVNGEQEVARWAGQVAFEARLQGAERVYWWCGLDFDLPGQDPYRHHAFELTFGALRQDRSPRPVAAALREACLCELPTLPEVGLLAPSYLHQTYPFNAAATADRAYTTRALRNAYAALRSLGYLPRVVYEDQLLAGAVPYGWLVAPSLQKLLAPTWEALERFPGRVLYSYFHGSGFWHGAWTNRAGSFFGGAPRNRYGLPEAAPTQLVAGGEALALPAHPDPFATTPLLLDPREAEVLGRDDRGRPLWVRAGNRDALLYPLEALAEDPQSVARFYRLALGAAPSGAQSPAGSHDLWRRPEDERNL